MLVFFQGDGGKGLYNISYTFQFQGTTAEKENQEKEEGGETQGTSGDSGWILDVSWRIRRGGVSGLPEVSQGLHPELPSTATDEHPEKAVWGGMRVDLGYFKRMTLCVECQADARDKMALKRSTASWERNLEVGVD